MINTSSIHNSKYGHLKYSRTLEFLSSKELAHLYRPILDRVTREVSSALGILGRSSLRND